LRQKKLLKGESFNLDFRASVVRTSMRPRTRLRTYLATAVTNHPMLANPGDLFDRCAAA